MARKDLSGQLGDKLGPRLVDLIVQAVIGTRRGLAPHEALVRKAASKALIDEAGREIADLYEPLLRDLLSRDSVDPLLREHIAKAASGRHQWQAIAGLAIGASGGGSAISQVMSNEIAPLVYGVIRDNPHLLPDPGTLAQLYARGIITEGNLVSAGGANGFDRGWSLALAEAAVAVPDIGTLNALVNRGLISESTAEEWMARAAVPWQLRTSLGQLRRVLLSPADAALAVLRGDLTAATGEEIAGQSGVHASDFAVILNNTGEPLGLEQLLEAYRRGYVTKARLERGIRQSRVRDEWIDVAEALRYSPVPTADAIDAYQRGRISKNLAYSIAEQNGVEPGQIDILAENAGNPPAPEQLLELWRRGKISEAQVNRGLLEGRTKDEWIPVIRALVTEPMSTADAVDAWLRGHITEAEAKVVMAENGVEARDIPALLANAGNPPAPGELAEALRRGIINEADYKRGIAQGRTRDDWTATLLKLAYSRMTTADAITASVQSYLTKEQAAKIAAQNGLAAEDFGPLWETAGEPLARGELLSLYNRGVIHQATVVQGLKESRLKDKYVTDAVALHTRLPQPREVVTALGDGAIDANQATTLLAEDGYSPGTIKMLIATGLLKSTGPWRELASGEITTLYADRAISRKRAFEMLTNLHYSPGTIKLMLDLADYKRDQKIRDSAITAIRSHFLAYRTDDHEAKADLLVLQIPSDTCDLYLQVWKLERLAHPKQLTEAQLVAAAKKNLFVEQGTMTTADWQAKNQTEGCNRLVKLGYSPADARLLLAGA